MSEYYSIDTLYRQSADWDISYDREHEVIYIENYFENPHEVKKHISERQYPLWKYNEERQSPNGIDYLDCRIVDTVGHPTRLWINQQVRITELLRQYGFHRGEYRWQDLIEVNCFKTIKDYDKTMQHFPHVDGNFKDPQEESVVNMLVYLDEFENGGTAVYKPTWLQNNEGEGLIQPVEEIMDIDHIIPSKFNRCVLFGGSKMHGAYIEDYNDYKDNWRYSFVNFFFPQGHINGHN